MRLSFDPASRPADSRLVAAELLVNDTSVPLSSFEGSIILVTNDYMSRGGDCELARERLLGVHALLGPLCTHFTHCRSPMCLFLQFTRCCGTSLMETRRCCTTPPPLLTALLQHTSKTPPP